MMALINNWDLKDDNNSVLAEKSPKEQVYLVQGGLYAELYEIQFQAEGSAGCIVGHLPYQAALRRSRTLRDSATLTGQAHLK